MERPAVPPPLPEKSTHVGIIAVVVFAVLSCLAVIVVPLVWMIRIIPPPEEKVVDFPPPVYEETRWRKPSDFPPKNHEEDIRSLQDSLKKNSAAGSLPDGETEMKIRIPEKAGK